MSRGGFPFVTDANVALLTDLYELTMLQGYWREELLEESLAAFRDKIARETGQ